MFEYVARPSLEKVDRQRTDRPGPQRGDCIVSVLSSGHLVISDGDGIGPERLNEVNRFGREYQRVVFTMDHEKWRRLPVSEVDW